METINASNLTWVIVDHTSYSTYMQSHPKDIKPALYAVIKKSGGISVCEAIFTLADPVKNTYTFFCWSTSGKNVYPEDVYAYAKLDIPQTIIDAIKANPKSKNSPFMRVFK